MKCQFCSDQATVHLTDIVKGQKKELHLCQACAEAQHLGPQTDELARLACPTCGLKYMEFRAQGRLGCPHDYNVFRTGLIPLLQRIHRSERHVGKSPRHGAPSEGTQAALMELRRRLQAAVQAEEYEEAARLRDLLRKKEATDESG